MFSEYSKGDTVSILYKSKHAGGVYPRSGRVLQTPGENKNGFFIQTDDDQMTVVVDGKVFSLTVRRDEETNERTIQRRKYLGKFESFAKTVFAERYKL